MDKVYRDQINQVFQDKMEGAMAPGQLHENLKRIFAIAQNANFNMRESEVFDKILQI